MNHYRSTLANEIFRCLLSALSVVAVWNAALLSPSSAQVGSAEMKKSVVLVEHKRGGGLPPEIGAGFFVTPLGHVLTAAHVILNSDEADDALRTRTIDVRLADRSRHVARILDVNRIVDLALLKIKVEMPTPYLALGNSESVRVGDSVIVVGHPLQGAEWETSFGSIERITLKEHMHVRATLGPGYSGGPAVNAKGQVVGVASYRAAGAEQSYLVPINDAQTVLAGILPGVSRADPSFSAVTSVAPTVIQRVKTPTKAQTFKNKFIRVTVRSFNRSPEKKKINLALAFENISKNNILVSLITGEENKYLIDDVGERWILSQKAVGITTICEHGCSPDSLFNPGQSSVVLFPFKSTGGLTGKTFDFAANLIAAIEKNGKWSRRFKFSIGISSLVP